MMISIRPYFTVITCTRNSGRFLPQCIQSVREQRFTDYEHVFVDGYSTDETLGLIEDYAGGDQRVRLVRAEPRGIANAMNVGFAASRGGVIHYLHSDDYYHSDRTLGIAHDRLSGDAACGLLIGARSVDTNGEVRSGGLSRSSYHRRRLLLRYLIYLRCYIAHPATFTRRDVFERNGPFDESFRIAMDYEYWLRILPREQYLMINEELTTLRVHPGAASFDESANLVEAERARALHPGGFRGWVARHMLSRLVALKMRLGH